jgi:hypothetical protein
VVEVTGATGHYHHRGPASPPSPYGPIELLRDWHQPGCKTAAKALGVRLLPGPPPKFRIRSRLGPLLAVAHDKGQISLAGDRFCQVVGSQVV